MGRLTPQYKKALYEELIDSINTNTSFYYAFASNPVATEGVTGPVTLDDLTSSFDSKWQMIFGKKIANSDVRPMIANRTWQSNTVYARYDNTSNTMYDTPYYVVMPPGIQGGLYHIYKCIDNANGAPSIQPPNLQQPATFTKSDGYKWRYIYSITSANYTKFATDDHIPVFPNTSLQAISYNYSGIDVVPVVNAGIGYACYHDGKVISVSNSTLIQISPTASTDNNFYTQNGIYIYNSTTATGQLRRITQYISNSIGNWVFVDSPLNTTTITPSVTNYKISPQVVFNADGDEPPKAYSVVNTFSNSIYSVVIIDTGYGISKANVAIVSNTVYGTGANVYAIAPPPGGHGFNPEVELDMKGIGYTFKFEKTEGNTISTDVLYNTVGIIKNPYTLLANTAKGIPYTSNTFDQMLFCNVSSTFAVGSFITGQSSGAQGYIAFANATQMYVVGDMNFANNEIVESTDGTTSSIVINTKGDIYVKDVTPLYIQNIRDVERDDTQTELFKIVVQV